jgi:16S rRNA (cytosine1407-C5)-methyltransferase
MKTTLPKKFITNLNKIYASSTVEQILNGLAAKRPTTFRTNTLKISTADLTKKLIDAKIDYQQLTWNPDFFILLSDKKQFIASDIYSKGLVYTQSLSSLLPALILAPQPNEIVLDLTAAPGSKTTQIAALMKNEGKILANDRHLIRLEKLKYNLKKQGVENAQVTNLLGQEIGSKYPNFFDKTLLDAPCSLEGTFNTNNPKTYQNWNQALVDALSKRQQELLYSAYLATKPGGTIVYSTCTLEVEENEMNINWLIKKTGNKVLVEEINLPEIPLTPGLLTGANQTFHPDLNKTIRVLPSELFEGFYLAKLKKIA